MKTLALLLAAFSCAAQTNVTLTSPDGKVLGTNAAFVKAYGPTLVFQRADGSQFGVKVEKVHPDIAERLGLNVPAILARKADGDAAYARWSQQQAALRQQSVERLREFQRQRELERKKAAVAAMQMRYILANGREREADRNLRNLQLEAIYRRGN